MPAYRAAGVNVRLSVFPLEDVSSLQSFDGEGSELYEEPLSYMGEDMSPHFLNGCPNAPFIFVRARGIKKDLKAILMEKIRSQRESLGRSPYSLRNLDSRIHRLSRSVSSEQSDDPSAPPEQLEECHHDSPAPKTSNFVYQERKALLLTIQLDPIHSFSRALDCERAKDMKIDVYLNGTLAHCHFISTRHKYLESNQVVKVSGVRSGRASEKAWIVQVGSERERKLQVSDDDAEMAEASGAHPVQLRWENICKALLESANQYGYKKGERPPSGQYLACLADSPFPDDLKHALQGREKQFAVLDCVITLGNGTKYPTSYGYMRKPKIMQDENFYRGSLLDDSPLPSPVPNVSRINSTDKIGSFHAESSPLGWIDHSSNAPSSSAGQPETFDRKLTDAGANASKPGLVTLRINKSFSKGPTRVPRKGSSTNTLAQSSHESALSDTVEPTTPTTTANQQGKTRLTLRYRRKALDTTTIEPSRVIEAVSTPLPVRNHDNMEEYSIEPDGGTGNSGPKRSGSKVPLVEPGWTIPQLSERSVVTYVEGDGDSDGVRIIRAERSGTFIEDEVLLGVRYLLGPDAAAA